MKVMVVGGGGREHAIIKGLAKSPKVDIIYALPGNGGIAADAECVDIGAKDLEGIKSFAVEQGIDYAVVAPDDPLAMGCVDVLQAEGIRCFGPDKKAAVIHSFFGGDDGADIAGAAVHGEAAEAADNAGDKRVFEYLGLGHGAEHPGQSAAEKHGIHGGEVVGDHNGSALRDVPDTFNADSVHSPEDGGKEGLCKL